jgi:hypothetical protein
VVLLSSNFLQSAANATADLLAGLRLATFVNPTIYRIGRGSSYHKAFHDVTPGTSGYPAGPGWDPVTGWAGPDAQVLVPLLAGFTDPGNR